MLSGKLSDPDWASELAAIWRTSMLSATCIDAEIDYVIDGWQEVLDSLAEGESE
jgi:hypothetical protein